MCLNEKSSFHLSFRCAVHSGQNQRAVPCNSDEGLCACPPIPVEPQTAGKSGCRESPAGNISKNEMQVKMFPLNHPVVMLST